MIVITPAIDRAASGYAVAEVSNVGFLCKPELPQTSRRYLAKFPDAEPITALGDFAFFRLEITGGRLASGFGGAINLTARSLPSLLAIGRPS